MCRRCLVNENALLDLVYMNRFYIYFHLDKIVEALLLRAVEGARFYRRRSLDGLGETYMAQGKPNSAIDSLKKAIKLAQLV